MKKQEMCIRFILLCAINQMVGAYIERQGDGFNVSFTVMNKGRVTSVIVWLEKINLGNCAVTCIQYLQCVSVNYHHALQRCELTDREFEEGSIDKEATDWMNYAAQRTAVNGNFSEWSSWSECNASCGEGRQVRQRTCDNPSQQHGGEDCKGNRNETRNCSNECVVNGEWGKWSTYTVCTKSCGRGTKTRTRRCDSPAPSPRGAHCNPNKVDEEKENDLCNTAPCDGCGKILHNTDINGAEGRMTREVKSWTACYFHCKKDYDGFVWGNSNFTDPLSCSCKFGSFPKNSNLVDNIISGYTRNDVDDCGAVLLDNNKIGTIQCKEAGEQLQIEWASYGPKGVIHDCAKEKTTLLKVKCNTKQTCTFYVSNKTINNGDNCPNIVKYLAVQYKCKSANTSISV